MGSQYALSPFYILRKKTFFIPGLWTTMGSQFDLFLLYISPRKTFFDLNLPTVFSDFWLLSGPPMGSQFDLFLSYIPPRKLFWFQFNGGFCSFLTHEIFYPPEGGPTCVVPLWGPNLISYFIISSLVFFLVSMYRRFLLIFGPWNFVYPPEGRPRKRSPYRVPIWSLSRIYSLGELFWV